MDDNGMVQAALHGELEAFNGLVSGYQDLVYHQALRMLDEPEAAEDFTQETFLLAYRNLGNFRGGTFRSWLLRIVTNLCLDELRRKKRRPTLPLEPVDENDEELESPHWMADPSETPEEAAERFELDRAIRQGLEALPNDHRTLLILIDLQGLDYSEAAQVMNIPIGTVKSRLARARQRLRRALQPALNPSPVLFGLAPVPCL